ncbi:uncharacterized protein FOMMEDRAFT_158187 [Fomitiporia mediterranea MF3/22]|uniref:uncharacterized protein n=1 Tax=Fomitiporia mediterranea (strain MF3/22) TaxID=694068 RepID=UPI0004407FE0|nr:uncharacterized protein FOMMEDRAFT_158187 [Fomitiporia mediterranea MF3/22]EJD01054.1 hypothetical protein FOMMEDRAFT_158187 [Fomitiporia mediterranea MF3/22]
MEVLEDALCFGDEHDGGDGEGVWAVQRRHKTVQSDNVRVDRSRGSGGSGRRTARAMNTTLFRRSNCFVPDTDDRPSSRPASVAGTAAIVTAAPPSRNHIPISMHRNDIPRVFGSDICTPFPSPSIHSHLCDAEQLCSKLRGLCRIRVNALVQGDVAEVGRDWLKTTGRKYGHAHLGGAGTGAEKAGADEEAKIGSLIERAKNLECTKRDVKQGPSRGE